MKTLHATLLAAALLAAPTLAGPGWLTDFPAARKLTVEEKKDILLCFTGLDWNTWCRKLKEEVISYKWNAYLAMGRRDEALEIANEITSAGPDTRFGKNAERYRQHLEKLRKEKQEGQGEDKENGGPARDEPADQKTTSHLLERGSMMLIALEEPAGGDAPKNTSKAKATSEEELKKRVADTRKEIEEVRHKIAVDHELWEKSESARKVSRARIAELEAALENEKVRYKKLEDTLGRIEKEHNGDHDAEDSLRSQLAEREKDLAEYQRKQEEIARLEKEAENLRRAAEKLRKRAEELRKK